MKVFFEVSDSRILAKRSINAQGKLKVGDRVILYPWNWCGDCELCKNGYKSYCPVSFGISLGIGKDGGYEQYVSCPSTQYAVPVPPEVDMSVACLAGCGALTAYGALRDVQDTIELYCKCRKSASLMIVGVGGLGLWCVSLAKSLFPSETNIYVADIDESKFDTAKDLGAKAGILWKTGDDVETTAAKTKSVTGDIHAYIDFVGNGKTIAISSKVLLPAGRGQVLVVGASGGTDDLVLDSMSVLGCLMTLKGHAAGSIEQSAELLQLIASGKVKVPPITRVSLGQAEQALEDLSKGKIKGRQVIDMSL